MGGRVPTWRMVPGSSTESLALDVALQCQVPQEIVHRAAHLFKVMLVLGLWLIIDRTMWGEKSYQPVFCFSNPPGGSTDNTGTHLTTQSTYI